MKNNNINAERDKFLKEKLEMMANEYDIRLTPVIITQIMTDLSDIYDEGRSKGWEAGYDEGHREGMADVDPDNYSY